MQQIAIAKPADTSDFNILNAWFQPEVTGGWSTQTRHVEQA